MQSGLSLVVGTLILQAAGRLGSSRQSYLLKLRKEHAHTDDGKVLPDHGGGFFIGTVLVGKPEPQEMHVAFSTSTGMVSFPSSDCQDAACKAHNRYNPLASSTSIDIQEDGLPVDPAGGSRAPPGISRDSTTLEFAASSQNTTGDMKGVFVSDVVCLGSRMGTSSSTEEPVCPRVRLLVATSADQLFRTGPQDGMVGLSLSALAINPEFHFISCLGNEGIQRRFGFWVADDAHTAELTFGGHDESRLESSLQWVPVEQPHLGHWLVDIVAIKVGNLRLDMCPGALGCRGLVHTSAPKMVVPTESSEQLLGLLKRDSSNMQECHFPQLSLVLKNGVVLELEAADYIGPDCTPDVTTHSLGTEAAGGAQLIVLGEPLLRRYYTVFDWSKPGLAFARVQVERSCRRLARAGLALPSHCAGELAEL
eukprot:TRINITY_DN10428_c1_g1_i2.p1 TRINITY_DN10428_c1_g1~~TRINITY_DN10428_c1_g1_i2.p1  ORF type:complete len:422 (-),score=77.15 TRINITY_DN10428_c1_g1_i2:136-1401(-)